MAIAINSEQMRDIRCKSCTRLLCRAHVFDGTIKCGRCKYEAHYSVLTTAFIEAIQKEPVAA